MSDKDKVFWLGMTIKSIPSIGHGSIGLLLWLAEKSDDEGILKSSFRDITAETGKSIGTVHRTIKALIKVGLLKVISGSGSQARTYQLSLKK